MGELMQLFTAGLTAARDVVQIVFFCVIAVITILTYLSAKKTILQPIRTEIFKEQLKALGEILRFFVGKQEIELRNDFRFDDVLEINSCALMDNYVSLFFDVKIDPKQRPYGNDQCAGFIISEEDIQEMELIPCDGWLKNENKKSDSPPPDPRTKAAIWSKHKHRLVYIPRRFKDSLAEFDRICESPLIPSKLATLLEEYRELLMNDFTLTAELLTECATELPEKYPNKEALARSSADWIRSRYVGRFKHLEPKAKEIVTFIRNYFGVDSLTILKKSREN